MAQSTLTDPHKVIAGLFDLDDSPSEGYGFTHHMEDKPEMRLFMSLFCDSLKSALLFVKIEDEWQNTSEEIRSNVLDALAWVIRDAPDWPMSIHGCCELLSLNVRQLRELIYNALGMDADEIRRFLKSEGCNENIFR